MQVRILAALLAGCAAAGAAYADTVVVNDQVQVRQSQVDRPRRGITMADVERQFGPPVTRPWEGRSPPNRRSPAGTTRTLRWSSSTTASSTRWLPGAERPAIQNRWPEPLASFQGCGSLAPKIRSPLGIRWRRTSLSGPT